jgi:hypothetical protein
MHKQFRHALKTGLAGGFPTGTNGHPGIPERLTHGLPLVIPRLRESRAGPATD